MKVSVKKIDSVRRELQFEIPKERVSRAMDAVYKDLSKSAKVKGFRPGKVPRHVLEGQHRALAREETIKKVISEAYYEAIEQEKLLPVDAPDIDGIDFTNGIIKFTAKLDIKPEVKLGEYKGIPVKRKSAAVTEEEINKTLEYFKSSQGEDKKDKPIDDEFARGLGYPNLDSFKQSLSRQMEIDKDRQNRSDVENQIVDHLIKQTKLVAPQSLVKRQLEHRLHEIKHRMEHQGVSKEEIQKREGEIRKDLEKAAEREVKVYLIFDEIAKLENIQIGEHDNMIVKIMEFLFKEANWQEN